MKWTEISPIKKYSWLLPLIAIILFFIFVSPRDLQGWGAIAVAVAWFWIAPIILAIITLIFSIIENKKMKREKSILNALWCMVLSVLIYYLLLFIGIQILELFG